MGTDETDTEDQIAKLLSLIAKLRDVRTIINLDDEAERRAELNAADLLLIEAIGTAERLLGQIRR